MDNAIKFAAPAGRILLAAIFLISGLQKLGDPAGTAAYIASGGLPGFLVWPTILLEVGGAILLILGWQVRLVALALGGFTLLAGILFHLIPGGAAEGMMAQLQMIMFLKNVSITGGLLFIVAMGAGPVSLDARGAARPALA